MSVEEHSSRIIGEYQSKYNLPVFVETGTAGGSTLELVVQAGQFDEYHSIELDDAFYRQACDNFENRAYIWHGESDVVLRNILPQIDRPCLFWLDAHWVGGEDDVMGSHGETPVMAELDAIFDTVHKHVILIDDARLFGVEGNYPTLQDLEAYALANGFGMEVEHDIIRLVEHDGA